MGEVVTMEELEELVRKYYDAVDGNDLETLFSVFSEDIVYERPGYSTIKGMKDFKDFYRNNRIIIREKCAKCGRDAVRFTIALPKAGAILGM